jgi:protein-disulfide isomerase
MTIKLDSVITVTLLICAVTTTSVAIRREFLAPPTPVARAERQPVLVPNWRDALSKGMRLGPAQAPVQLIEFADFECPFCGDFHKKLNLLRERYPTQVSLTYIHFPLPMHRFAIPAARVAECARDQSRFEAMYDQLFDGQGFFGLKPWSDFARAAGVPDLAAFDICIEKSDIVARVEQGKELGAKLDIQATPTLIVNGWKLGRPPTAEELDGMVKAILAGKSPVPGGKS